MVTHVWAPPSTLNIYAVYTTIVRISMVCHILILFDGGLHNGFYVVFVIQGWYAGTPHGEEWARVNSAGYRSAGYRSAGSTSNGAGMTAGRLLADWM